MATIKFTFNIAGENAKCSFETDDKNTKKFLNARNKERILKDVLIKQCIITGYEVKQD